MTEWMSYVYEQFAKPTNVQGVNVEISVIDANGNFRTIGTTTSDASGTYSLHMDTRYSRQIHCNRYLRRHKLILWLLCRNRLRRRRSGQRLHRTRQLHQFLLTDLYFVPAVAAIIIVIVVVGAVLALTVA